MTCGCAPSSDRSASAGGQLEQPCDVNSSSSTGAGGSSAWAAGGLQAMARNDNRNRFTKRIRHEAGSVTRPFRAATGRLFADYTGAAAVEWKEAHEQAVLAASDSVAVPRHGLEIRFSRRLQRNRARSFSAARVRTAPRVLSSASSCSVAAAIASTARSTGAWSACEGLAIPPTLRTYCSAAARISSGVVGGAKLCRTRMLRHMAQGYYERDTPKQS